ncbi:50S ribosomal protein L4 [Desulfonatronospira sp.]|uniref:50S ribosomal protein L4 n=1 Tax=Desulfonatronospira sp. TaxID=1962951 RepID=UPI0025B97EDA|nr:50S ribosomal protein L4 [Desulfonatronospira sp.]
MLSAKVYSQDNQEVGEINLQENVFSVSVKPELMHQAVRAHRAAVRSGTVGVKNRALISGGGRKPWRQKGTGRARAGTGRSPLWRGGAVIHGPKARDYSIKLNKKVRRLALKMALSTKYAQDELQIVDKIELGRIRTKDFVNIKNNLGLKKPLIVIAEKSNNLELSARNVPGVEVITQDSINVYEILKHQELVMDKQAVEKLQERLG